MGQLTKRVVIVGALVALGACSEDRQEGVSSNVGPAGGILALDGGPTLRVPPGALSRETTLGIESIGFAGPQGAPAFRFVPEGTTFAVPVQVTFPLPEGWTAASVYWSKEATSGAYDALPATVTADGAVASVTHFSVGYVGPPCTEGATCDAGECRLPGTQRCESGWAVCEDPGEARPDGSSCGDGQYCLFSSCTGWRRVLPRGVVGFSLWGAAREDVWMARGIAGRAARWDGAAWRDHPGPTGLAFALWGTSATDVWAATAASPTGPATVERWDGASWRTVLSTSARPTAIWGSSPHDVWVAGEGGVLARWDGTAWQDHAQKGSTHLYALWGSAPGDVWAAGSPGLLHWDGSSWSEVPGIDAYLLSVWGSSPTDVWAAGTSGTLLHWDGTAWSRVPTGTTASLRSVWGASSSDVWIAGEHAVLLRWNGASLERVEIGGESLNAIWGTARDDVWGAGSEGSILRWDGEAWTVVAIGRAEDVGGSGPSDVWVVGWPGNLVRWDGLRWTKHGGPGPSDSFFAVWANGPDDVWAAGAGLGGARLWRWDGGVWSDATGAATGILTQLRALWGSGPGHLVAVGTGGTILHWNGTTWSAKASGTTQDLLAVWGSAPDDVWAAGVDQTMLHYDGVAWAPVETSPMFPLTDYWGLWGAGADDVWVVGDGGDIQHWNGIGWGVDGLGAGGITHDVLDVWGSGPGDAWSVGARGTIQRYDGRLWNVETWSEDRLEWLQRVWGSAGDDVWAVGSGVFHHGP